MFERWNDPLAVEWAKRVKVRDNYICQLCYKYGIPLHAHHLNSWNTFVNQRYELYNGITLCTKHHELFHHIYGKGNNTKFQFLQFKKSVDLFKKANRSIIR